MNFFVYIIYKLVVVVYEKTCCVIQFSLTKTYKLT